ncbi:MAG TPA: TMEM175 family protein [Candidatus Eremiobacteraceae bacterium]|nr:TMEM175 family protein [Candidatus Eremiobacteraceae bacterium]
MIAQVEHRFSFQYAAMAGTQPPNDVVISKGRFEAFSDGVFAIAITLLVLELHPPDLANPSNGSLVRALLAMWPEFLVYWASFATIGIVWFNHYALFHNTRDVTYTALIANLALLSFVCFVPFTTLLIAREGMIPIATALYGIVLLLLSACYNVLLYVVMLPPGERGTFMGFLRQRNAWNTLGPVVYAGGTLLAFVSPLASILLFSAIAVFYLLPGTVRSTLESTGGADTST